MENIIDPPIKYEVREIDALWYDDGWSWNSSFHIGEFHTKAKNEKQAFIRFLNKKGIRFKKNHTRIVDEMDVLEVQDRKTHEPLFAAIWKES